MKNNFIDLLDYCYSSSLDHSSDSVLIELKEYLLTPYLQEGTNFNIIPLERIIYLYLEYSDNEEIQNTINEIFQKISFNYQQREKLLNRIYMPKFKQEFL